MAMTQRIGIRLSSATRSVQLTQRQPRAASRPASTPPRPTTHYSKLRPELSCSSRPEARCRHCQESRDALITSQFSALQERRYQVNSLINMSNMLQALDQYMTMLRIAQSSVELFNVSYEFFTNILPAINLVP